MAVAADEPAGKAVADCPKRTVSLTLHRGAAAGRLLHQLGPRGFRRQRIPDRCQQALSEGALLTREDLAGRLFLVGWRTVSLDLAWLRANDERPLPLDVLAQVREDFRYHLAALSARGELQRRLHQSADLFREEAGELVGSLRPLVRSVASGAATIPRAYGHPASATRNT